jgi:cupin domain
VKACWEPGQISPYHCHPQATEIYFCFEGGGTMRTPDQTVEVTPGSFVVHPAGELHEYANGPQHASVPRTLRPRHGGANFGVAGQYRVETKSSRPGVFSFTGVMFSKTSKS